MDHPMDHHGAFAQPCIDQRVTRFGDPVVAPHIMQRVADLDRLHHIGELEIAIADRISACARHPAGHIGIRGVERNGAEFYQVSLGGDAGDAATVIGPALAGDEIVDAVENLIGTYLDLRRDDERFLDTYRRLGIAPFRERLYALA
jgi:sulfite reductase (NADPH) hemoprotein beta-component